MVHENHIEQPSFPEVDANTLSFGCFQLLDLLFMHTHQVSTPGGHTFTLKF